MVRGEAAPAGPEGSLVARRRAGRWLWSDRRDGVEVRFVGRGDGAGQGPAGPGAGAGLLAAIERAGGDGARGEERDRREASAAAGAARRPPAVAWLRQVHSASLLPGRPGECGEADGLWTGEAGLALCVATADCVAVLLAAGGRVAAVHAGWRGIAGGIIPAALAALGDPGPQASAWLGPAIGPCCYEVRPDVAARVAAASHEAAVRPGRRGRPHLHLHTAVLAQLAAGGVVRVRRAPECTCCCPERLWSHRGSLGSPRAAGAPPAVEGRNLAFVWRREPGRR